MLMKELHDQHNQVTRYHVAQNNLKLKFVVDKM